MTQLLLDLERPLVPTFDNFIVGRNAEALAALRGLDAAGPTDPSSRCLYLWGAAASGRSHLLRAACRAFAGRYFAGAATSSEALRAALDEDRGGARRMVAVDDVEALDAPAQEALFHTINVLRSDRGILVVAGNAAPRELGLHPGRDDLRSRLAWGLGYPLHPLDDEEKDAALAHRADDQGFPLTPDVRRYLLTHFSRDLGALMRMVDALDQHAREKQRIVTVPLIRDFLQRSIAFPQRDQPVDQIA